MPSPKPSLIQVVGLWLLFAVVLAWPFLLHLIWGGDVGFGDVRLYREWALDGVDHGRWPVLDFDWIYPLGALVPIAALAPFAHSPIYESSFVAALYLTDAVIMMVLRDRIGARAAAWWLAFLLMLGPIAVSRLDGVAAALATVALLVVVNRPRLATGLVTAAAWIKVAHAAWILPLLICSRRRLHDVLVPAAAFTLLVAAAALLFGGESRLFSFAQGQSGRALQMESVAATPFNVIHALGHSSGLHRNPELITWEFIGPAAQRLTHVMDALLPLAVLAIGALTLLASRRNRTSRPELLLLSVLATTLALIVFNKVGSPQYIVWLASPIAVSFSIAPRPRSVWPRVRLLTLVVAATTQVIYPVGYSALIDGDAWVVGVLVLRNVALVCVLLLVIRELWLTCRLAKAVKDRYR